MHLYPIHSPPCLPIERVCVCVCVYSHAFLLWANGEERYKYKNQLVSFYSRHHRPTVTNVVRCPCCLPAPRHPLWSACCEGLLRPRQHNIQHCLQAAAMTNPESVGVLRVSHSSHESATHAWLALMWPVDVRVTTPKCQVQFPPGDQWNPMQGMSWNPMKSKENDFVEWLLITFFGDSPKYIDWFNKPLTLLP